jgi:hypothetical protein
MGDDTENNEIYVRGSDSIPLLAGDYSDSYAS